MEIAQNSGFATCFRLARLFFRPEVKIFNSANYIGRPGRLALASPEQFTRTWPKE